MNVDAMRDVTDAGDQALRRIVSHYPRQRWIGVEKRAARRRDVDTVHRALEQFAIALLCQPLFGERMHRRLARGVGVDKRPPEYFGGAGDIADLIVDVRSRDRRVLLAGGPRPERGGGG